MAQVNSRKSARQESAATEARNFRTFLLVSQLEAKAIGARIARARDEAGLTQEQLCDLATFSKRSLSDYENGVTIPYKHMREISRLLERPVEWFLHGEQEPTEDLDERLGALEGKVDRLDQQTALGFASLEAAIGQLAARLPRPGGEQAAG